MNRRVEPMVVRVARVVAIVCTLGLTGCGGGGGGGSSANQPPIPAGPRLTVSQNDVSVSARYTEFDAPEVIVRVYPHDLPTGKPYHVRPRNSGQGVASVLMSSINTNDWGMSVRFKPPYTIPEGSYEDTIHVDVCEDLACTAAVPIATTSITAKYQVLAPPANAMPALTASTSAINVSAMMTDAEIRIVNVEFAITNIAPSPTIKIASTKNGVFSSSWGRTTSFSGAIRMDFRLGGELGIGTHTDTLTIEACIDPQCVHPLPQSPLKIPVQIAVTNVVTGPKGYQIDVLPFKAHDVAADTSRSRLYFATPNYPTKGANTITIVDPRTRAIVSSVPVPDVPRALAISDDAQFLYVDLTHSSQLARLRLPDLTQERIIPLGTVPNGTPLTVMDMRGLPGAPKSVAMIKGSDPSAPLPWELTVYDDMVARPNVIALHDHPLTGLLIDRLESSGSGSKLYGASTGSEHRSVYDISLDAMGATIAHATPDVAQGGLHLSGGRLYTDGGTIFDPVNHAVVGELPIPRHYSMVIPNHVPNTVFAVRAYSEDNQSRLALSLFDTTTLTEIRRLQLYPHWGLLNKRATKWADDGIALIGYSGIGYDDGFAVVISGPFIGEP